MSVSWLCETNVDGRARGWTKSGVASCLVCVGVICGTWMKSCWSLTSGRGVVCGRISLGFGTGVLCVMTSPGCEVC